MCVRLTHLVQLSEWADWSKVLFQNELEMNTPFCMKFLRIQKENENEKGKPMKLPRSGREALLSGQLINVQWMAPWLLTHTTHVPNKDILSPRAMAYLLAAAAAAVPTDAKGYPTADQTFSADGPCISIGRACRFFSKCWPAACNFLSQLTNKRIFRLSLFLLFCVCWPAVSVGRQRNLHIQRELRSSFFLLF